MGEPICFQKKNCIKYKIPLDSTLTSYPTFVPGYQKNRQMEKLYAVKKLAAMAGVSVRTLHHYDRIGLLQPSKRTPAGYRLYGEAELLRLQQILFYKELDLSLEEIATILDDPAFEVLTALENHRKALEARRNRLSVLLATIDKTILKLKGGPVMLTNEELYEGFPRESAAAYRQQAVEKWGAATVEASEQKLRKLGKAGYEKLKEEAAAISNELAALMHLQPEDDKVQAVVARHYAHILQFWASVEDTAAAYRGLAQLYLDDERYTHRNGKPDPAYAAFLSKAMVYYADTRLKKKG